MRDQDLHQPLLAWYDRHARLMPWRISPADRAAGVMPNPYHIWMSEVMLQQTTVAAVKTYFEKFTRVWPTVHDLAAADDADVMAAWAGLGYYARARNLLKCARVVSQELDGKFPTDNAALLKLPGVGPYTAAAIGSIAFDKPQAVVDGNVERVLTRMFRIETPLPTAKPAITVKATALTPTKRPGDYAQAIMDLGATICTPRSPTCSLCPWRDPCQGFAKGDQTTFPKKLPKVAKPIRFGTVYVLQRDDGAVLLERRPDNGLLGGMLGWPGNTWAPEPEVPTPPTNANWTSVPGEVRHTFTHFHLRLAVQIARTPDFQPEIGRFLLGNEFDPQSLPTVMRKVWDLASTELGV